MSWQITIYQCYEFVNVGKLIKSGWVGMTKTKESQDGSHRGRESRRPLPSLQRWRHEVCEQCEAWTNHDRTLFSCVLSNTLRTLFHKGNAAVTGHTFLMLPLLTINHKSCDKRLKNRQQPVFYSVKLTANKKDLAVHKLPINVAKRTGYMLTSCVCPDTN